MKRSSGFIKKKLALVLMLLLSIESFAAVVGDNDGAAFITKAEFDSMKNNFQSQLDRYNSSIDNKIDGAIAAYLAGININKKVITNIINKDWSDVSAVGGSLKNSYQVPDVHIIFVFNFMNRQGQANMGTYGDAPDVIVSETGNAYEGHFNHLVSLSYTNQDWSSVNSYRNLVDCTGTTNSPGDMIWAGRAIKYKEQFNITSVVGTWLGTSSRINVWPHRFDLPSQGDYSMTLRNLTTLSYTGLISDWKTQKTQMWPINYRWIFTHNGTGPYPAGWQEIATFSWDAEKSLDSFLTRVELLPDSQNRTIDYTHVIAYNGSDTWRVSNQSWVNLFRTADDNTCKSSTLASLGTLTNSAKGMSWGWYNTIGSGWPGAQIKIDQVDNFYGKMGVDTEIVNDDTLSSIGMLSNDVQANNIYQDNIQKNVEIDGLRVYKDRPTLEDGFQLCPAQAGDTIEWEPVFNYTHVHNGDVSYAPDNNHEVDVFFSAGPFSNKTTSTKPIEVLVGADPNKKNYATTNGRRCKIKWTMPETGIVYVKFVPHFEGSSYIDKDWIVTLNLQDCNTYSYVRE